MDWLDPALFATVLRVMTPLLLAALGVLISDRAGVLNIGMEGMMLIAALVAVLASAATGNPLLGLLAALAAGGGLGALMALVVNRLRADVIVAGIALNIAAASLTTIGLFLATGDRGMSGALDSGRLPSVALPLGPYLTGHHVLTWVAIACVPVVAWLVGRTVFGLRLRAVGLDAEAAAKAGVSVARVRLGALVLSGMFGGAAGAYLSLGYVTWFAQGMTAGRGFIAIAIEVMGMGTAWGTLAAALLIAVSETFAISMQALGLPSELMQIVPYAVPVGVLALVASRRRTRRVRALRAAPLKRTGP